MLCYRGCGLLSTYTNYNGLLCCDKKASKCPVIKKKIGEKNSVALTGKKLTEEHKFNISEGLKEHSVNDDTRQKIKTSVKEYWTNRPREPWNKGLTKNDPRVAAYANTQRGTKRKKESEEIMARDSIVYSNFKKYRNRISTRTRKTYKEYKTEINPNNLPIGKCGVIGAYQIDHIISVRLGFEQGISIEQMSSKENLQLISWEENIKKYDGKGNRKSN
jgi:hypothetical protein